MRGGVYVGVRRRDPRGGARSWTAVVGLLAFAGAVAAAARGAPAWAPLREGYGDRWAILIEVLALAGVVCVAGSLLIWVLHRFRVKGRPEDRSLVESFVRAAPIIAVALAVLALLFIARVELYPGAPVTEIVRDGDGERERGRRLDFLDHRATVVVGGEESLEPEHHAVSPTDPSAYGRRLLLAVAGALLTILATIIGLRYRRGSDAGATGGEVGDSAADDHPARAAVAATIQSMLADPDPRTAVIGAYARLLEGLAACGGGRHDHEAPLEHLRRVLALLRVRREPLRELIGLFEVARFSTHRLTAEHRHRALGALHAVAADLAVSVAAPEHSTHGSQTVPDMAFRGGAS